MTQACVLVIHCMVSWCPAPPGARAHPAEHGVLVVQPGRRNGRDEKPACASARPALPRCAVGAASLADAAPAEGPSGAHRLTESVCWLRGCIWDQDMQCRASAGSAAQDVMAGGPLGAHRAPALRSSSQRPAGAGRAHWLPLVPGPALAMDMVNGRSWRRLRLNSSANSPPQMLCPPVPSPARRAPPRPQRSRRDWVRVLPAARRRAAPTGAHAPQAAVRGPAGAALRTHAEARTGAPSSALAPERRRWQLYHNAAQPQPLCAGCVRGPEAQGRRTQ